MSEEIQLFVDSCEKEKIVEKVVKTAMGSQHLLVKIKRMLDVSEKFTGCVIIIDDVTHKKKAESELQETTIWLTEMFNALEEGVFLTIPAGRIVDMNAAAEKILGYSTEEMKNNTTEVFHVDQDHFQKFRKRVRKALSKGEKSIFEYGVNLI